MSGPDDKDSALNATNGHGAKNGGGGAKNGGGGAKKDGDGAKKDGDGAKESGDGARSDKNLSAAQDGRDVLAFPQSRATPPRGTPEPFKDLGTSKMCQALGMPKEQTTGHWCSHCKGIWFGYLLEVECPICGGRDG